jgi:D-3-phosphoglycerate dehydrogenase
MVTIAALGDNFVLPELFQEAVRRLSPESDFTFHSLTLPWPQVPFDSVGSVLEASGTEDNVIGAVGSATIAVSQLAPFTKKVFDACPALKMVAISRGGPVNVDLDAATEAGVVVSFAPGRNAQAAAEFAVGMMLAAMRRVGDGSAALHQGQWRGDYYTYPNAGMELSGNTVGLIGYGAIGRIVAGILRAFNAEVLVFDPYLSPSEVLPAGVRIVSLDELLTTSKVVSVHARLSPESQHILNAETLAMLPHGAVLINTARGGLLDYSVLPAMLQSGQLGAIALDVFDVEPPPANWPLLGHDNVVLTPHLAGATKQTAERAATIVATDVARFIEGQAPLHVANSAVMSRLGLRT